MTTAVRGRVWKLGDDVDTDAMAPWSTLSLPWEERRKAILQQRPELVREVSPGDVIVAGRNWGCGSSREHAAENLKQLGLGGVVAESFGRIYFRNCVAIAFPNLACPGVYAAFAEGEEIEFDLRTGTVCNRTRNVLLHGEAYTDDMLHIVEQGGLLEVLRRRLGGTSP